MAGNSRRRGAVRKAGSKKGPTVGSGGQGRQALEGRGPTPKAVDRVGHPAAKRQATKRAAAKRREAAAGTGSAAAGSVRAAAGRTRPSGPGRGGTGRPGSEAEVVVGRNAVVEALRAGVRAGAVYVATRIDADDRVREVLRTASARGLPLLEVTRPELDRLAGGAVHQGVAIQVPPHRYVEPLDLVRQAQDAGRPPLVVALDGVTDPRNLGAVIRSAAAFGADGVLLPERRSAGVTAAVWKVSAGAASRLPVARATNLVRALGDLKDHGCFVVGLDGAGPADVRELELATGPLVLVAGSEGKGLSRLVREACDVVAAIPIASSVESLNAAVATGIALYEVARRRAATAG
jgi:23S rRNA (guanosine2251-2'-O)-methyltransferase